MGDYKIQLLGKVIIHGDIEVKTGLMIGGISSSLKIGGVDISVITDPWGKPYIPGSSLKGKMRTLIEKKEGLPINAAMTEKEQPWRHQCQTPEDYQKCSVCKVWGIIGGGDFKIPVLTRLIVRDTYLDEESITKEMKANLELDFTETKMETAIDRVKGQATGPRTTERVPAGACFKDCELIYSLFYSSDLEDLKKVFEALELLEHDYLGGSGTRGYGKVVFKNLRVYCNTVSDYESGQLNLSPVNGDLKTPSEVIKNFEEIKKKIKEKIASCLPAS
ncbi:MAG: type III-A CRISPR-associated RAMP protein Csm3 [Caldiserica bacterium]|jgi:CRISPR-associated protein Csm3|nr:type III-A CRISPR-associated RAMP protein Csm3 [Caldisericota bacterium]MDH7562833.1 type III-A CRISPR-associated RAMP protein Csm3 [Caldisericota bacterium]